MPTNEWKWNTKDGLEMYAGEWLPQEKAKGVVCLVHGVGEHIGRYRWDGEALTRAGYILAGFDLRGFGRSGGVRGFTPSLDAYYEDLDLFLAQVSERHPGLPRFLYGHSMGGILVLAYTPLRKPALAGVIATGPGLSSAIEAQKFKVLLTKIFGKVYPALALESGLEKREICRDPQVVEDYINDPLVHTRVSAGWGLAMLQAIASANAQAAQFPVPLLLMHASGDRLSYLKGSQAYAALVPAERLTFKVWDGLKHELHTDPEREQVFQFMVEWLNDRK